MGGTQWWHIVLVPVSLGPDIVSNTVLYLFNPLVSKAMGKSVSNLWPIVSLGSPVFGLVGGAFDAAAGYPFWDPVALEENRRYPWLAREEPPRPFEPNVSVWPDRGWRRAAAR